MENTTHRRIRQRLAELGLSENAASERAGLDRGYLSKILKRPDSKPNGKSLIKLASALETTPSWLLGTDIRGAALGFVEEPGPDYSKPLSKSSIATVDSVRFLTMEDVPVFGTASGSLASGGFIVEDDVIDEVSRPIGLRNNRNAYALFVENTSMVPQFSPGDLIFLNPNRPPRTGEAVVVRTRSVEDKRMQASLGIFLRRTEHSIVIGKHNPPGTEVEIRREGAEVHKVMTMNELFAI